MSIKKVLLIKKINNTIYDVFPKTSADAVVYGDSTVAATLASFATDLADIYKKSEADAAIKTSADALYNKIMGVTEQDGATVSEAYDTLKEVAAWINEHGDVVTAFTTDINGLKSAVSTLQTGFSEVDAAVKSNDTDITNLQTAVNALVTAVGNAESGLVKDVATIKTDIESLKTVVGDENSGLVKQVSELSAGSGNHTEASENNGNIKVDGEEVVVYRHPESHSASMIEETDDRKFMTSTEKAAIANVGAITFVSSQDEVTSENDLYLVEIAQ